MAPWRRCGLYHTSATLANSSMISPLLSMTSFWRSSRSWRRVSAVLETPRSSRSARASRKSVSAYDDESTVVTLEERGFAALAVTVGDGAAEPCGERGREPEVMVKYAECISLSQSAFWCLVEIPLFRELLLVAAGDLEIGLVLCRVSEHRGSVTMKYGIHGARPTVTSTVTNVPFEQGPAFQESNR